MLSEPDRKPEDQPRSSSYTTGGNNNSDDDKGCNVGMPSWMFKDSNHTEDKKRAPEKGDHGKKLAKPKKNDIHLRWDVKVHGKCVA